MEIWDQIAATEIARFVAGTAWAYPILETIHLVGIGLVFGLIVLFDLRVLGFARGLPVDALARSALRLVWFGFSLNVVSGLLLFVADAPAFARNPALQLKLALIVVAGLNAAVFQSRRSVTTGAAEAGFGAKVQAGLSIVLWIGIVTAGRMIAYWGD